jgi:hypothetical protein
VFHLILPFPDLIISQNSIPFDINMPQSKTKASDVAIEAKRIYIPQIARDMPSCPPRSLLHSDAALIPVAEDFRSCGRPRVTVEDYDPIDIAIHWKDENRKLRYGNEPPREIPVVNMANERRAGGDWESALVAPEECFARRSNLVHALPTPWNYETSGAHYPIPQTGGLYSPSIGKTALAIKFTLSCAYYQKSFFEAAVTITKHGNNMNTAVYQSFL